MKALLLFLILGLSALNAVAAPASSEQQLWTARAASVAETAAVGYVKLRANW